MHQKSHWTK